MTADRIHEDGIGGEPSAIRAEMPCSGWRLDWATGGLITPVGAAGAVAGPGDWVRSVATTVLDGRAIAVTGGDNDDALVWDVATGERIGAPLPARGPVWAVATQTVAGRPVAVVAGPSTPVQTWDLAARRPLARLAGGAWSVATAVVDGSLLALVGRQSAPRLLMWDPATGETVADLEGGSAAGGVGAVVAVTTAVVDGQAKAVTLHDDSSLHLWCLTGQRHQGRSAPLAGGSRQRVSLATAVVEGHLLAVTGSWDGQVRVYDVTAGAEADGRMPSAADTGPVWALATGVVEGRPVVAASGDDRTVRVWDLVAHRQVSPDLTFPSEVTALAMAPDGRLTVGFGPDLAVFTPHSPARAATTHPPEGPAP
ncbi:WD40 repeat domain-containing protein [Streptomyces sp. NPDC059582]|uniref:WD40 repeat domain-containing protein n=1 Tax=Streptomyces sp. NPDC059582 TaxID=3346875 RepID=UPI0036967B2E